jgi:hypothetical protein
MQWWLRWKRVLQTHETSIRLSMYLRILPPRPQAGQRPYLTRGAGQTDRQASGEQMDDAYVHSFPIA